MNRDYIIKLLEKRAKGFSYSETHEEFIVDEVKRDSIDNSKILSSSANAPDLTVSSHINKSDDDAVLLVNQSSMINCNRRPRGRPRKLPSAKMILVKKKVSTYYVPPDMSAIKILLDMHGIENNLPIEDVAKKRAELLNEIIEIVKAENKFEV